MDVYSFSADWHEPQHTIGRARLENTIASRFANKELAVDGHTPPDADPAVAALEAEVAKLRKECFKHLVILKPTRSFQGCVIPKNEDIPVGITSSLGTFLEELRKKLPQESGQDDVEEEPQASPAKKLKTEDPDEDHGGPKKSDIKVLDQKGFEEGYVQQAVAETATFDLVLATPKSEEAKEERILFGDNVVSNILFVKAKSEKRLAIPKRGERICGAGLGQVLESEHVNMDRPSVLWNLESRLEKSRPSSK